MNGWNTEYGITSKRVDLTRLTFEWTKEGYKCRFENSGIILKNPIPDLKEAKLVLVKKAIARLQDTLNALQVELIELEKEDKKTLDR